MLLTGDYLDRNFAVPGGKEGDEGMVALVNVKTDYRARATTVQYSSRMT